VLSGKQELDIFVPSKQLAIEYNGLFYHTYDRVGNKHYDKWAEAKAKGVQLIHLFEDEWIHKRSACENRLRSLLGVNNSVYARNTELQKLTFKQANDFLTAWHIQGAGTKTPHCYGLHLEGRLVAVATFCKLRNGAGLATGENWEVLRYASIGSVVGGFSRLFKRFLQDTGAVEVISYCDLRWGTGKLYKACGFVEVAVTKPDYWWADCAARVRYPRHHFQRHKLKDSIVTRDLYADGKTEAQLLTEAGLKKIMGVGSSKWVWRKEP
jgi:hypothetical protein